MVVFFDTIALDEQKLEILENIFKMPNFGNNLKKKLGHTKDDAEKIFFIRQMGIQSCLENWLSQQWDFTHNTYYIAIHPLFFKAYKKWQKELKKRKSTK